MNKPYMLLEDIEHCLRVGNLACSLATVLKLNDCEIKDIYIAAMLHDIGKTFLNKEILNKPGKLTDEEYKHVKNHVGFGAEEVLKIGYNKNIADYILYHHENYDGTGYAGLKGKEIPIGACIIRICDTYDALLMKRPYKDSFTQQEALNEIIKTKRFYNKLVFDVFVKLFNKEEGEDIYEKAI